MMEPFTKEQLEEMPEADLHKKMKELRDIGLDETNPILKQLMHEYKYRECIWSFGKYVDFLYYYFESGEGANGEVICKICVDHSLYAHENKVTLEDQYQTIKITFYLAFKYREIVDDLMKYIRTTCGDRRLRFEF